MKFISAQSLMHMQWIADEVNVLWRKYGEFYVSIFVVNFDSSYFVNMFAVLLENVQNLSINSCTFTCLFVFYCQKNVNKAFSSSTVVYFLFKFLSEIFLSRWPLVRSHARGVLFGPSRAGIWHFFPFVFSIQKRRG